MRRLLLIAAIALAGAIVPAVATATTGTAYLRGLQCRPSLDPSKRVVSITAVMDTVPGTQHLRMRFELTQRVGANVAQVHAGDLGKWISPASPTFGQHPSDQWVVNHPVIGLPVPAYYRFHVAFRWIAADGHVIGQLTRSSEVCRQPDMRPDLSVRLVTAQPSGSGEQYEVQVENTGLTAATNVELQFAPGGGAPTKTATIGRLRAHATVDRWFTGPACTSTSGPVTFTADPSDLIDVVSRADNSVTAPCTGS